MTAPHNELKTEKMPGHWVLARLGKRVLRPGGLELTHTLLNALDITSQDEVIEFAPGLGATARLTLERHPASYTAVERDYTAARTVAQFLTEPTQRCVVGTASDTGLPASSATVVYGEAVLTMQTEETKRSIVREAYRLLEDGGRYGIHEMCLRSDNLDSETKKETKRALTSVVHHGVRPISTSDWRSLLESEGFTVSTVDVAPMHLLEPGRIIRDEGVAGTLRFISNVVRDSAARKRMMEMRSIFRQLGNQIGAVAITARKL